MSAFGIAASASSMSIVESKWAPAPRQQTPGEEARAIVRHGMADVLAWLGEPLGPRPGAAVHTTLVGNGVIFAHPLTVAMIRREAKP